MRKLTISISFLREFAPGPTSGSSTPSDKAKPNGVVNKGKAKDNKKYSGSEPFIPEDVYDALKGLSRFDALRVSCSSLTWTQLTISEVSRKTLKSSSAGSSKLCTRSFFESYQGLNLHDHHLPPDLKPTGTLPRLLDPSRLLAAGSRLARSKRPMLSEIPRPANRPSRVYLAVHSDPSSTLPVKRIQSPWSHTSPSNSISNHPMSSPSLTHFGHSTNLSLSPNTDLVKVWLPLPSRSLSRLSHLF